MSPIGLGADAGANRLHQRVPPRFVQGAGAQVVSAQQFVVDGAAYGSLGDVPDEARERLAAAMAQVSALQGQLGGAPAAQAPRPGQAPQQIPHVTVVGEGGGGRARLILLALLALALVAGAAYWLGTAAR